MSEKIRNLSFQQAIEALNKRDLTHASGYLAMYSSWLGGIIKDAPLMMVPIDDHLVHRGDGIFEAMKCEARQIYCLERHLQRLWKSAELVHMPMPVSMPGMTEIIFQTVRAAGVDDSLIRLYVSRGPGGFTTNPYECVGSQLYIVITSLRRMAVEKMEKGVTAKTSSIPVKEGWFANVKSCNYLHNVLMKKEAIDAGVDFTTGLDESGFVGEGSTENFFILSDELELLVPRFERTLRGVTITRLMELAKDLVDKGEIKKISQDNFRPEDVYRAREAYFAGTTMDVVPVVRYDGHVIGDGVPGPIYKKLLALIRKDIKSGAAVLTPI